MIEIRNVSWKKDIIETAIEEQRGDSTLFLVPTNLNKTLAISSYQRNLDFNGDRFLTLEEWKDSLFVSTDPVLREEKRSLTLYNCLTADDRNFFRLHSYFQAITFLNDFLNFWEEFAEEQIDEQEVFQVIPGTVTTTNWQQEEYKHLINIREQ